MINYKTTFIFSSRVNFAAQFTLTVLDLKKDVVLVLGNSILANKFALVYALLAPMLQAIFRVFIFGEFCKRTFCAAGAALFHCLGVWTQKSPHRRAAGAYRGVSEGVELNNDSSWLDACCP
jgi:hypothetical protein